MESTFNAIEKLIQKVETYCKTSLELFKYEAANKVVKAASFLSVIQILSSIIIFATLFTNIGLALWIGQLLGEIYFGFFAVALFYLVLALFLFIFRKALIVKPTEDFVIRKLKSENFL
jgi:hypothetical protein